MINIQDDSKEGKSFRIFYGKDNVNNRIVHIRAIVDDEMIVFRWWSRQKQGWIYEVQHLYFFELRNDGRLRPYPRKE